MGFKGLVPLPGEEGLEIAGLPSVGVVARSGVAVRDGSTLAIGVISVPMSTMHTVRMFTEPVGSVLYRGV